MKRYSNLKTATTSTKTKKRMSTSFSTDEHNSKVKKRSSGSKGEKGFQGSSGFNGYAHDNVIQEEDAATAMWMPSRKRRHGMTH